MELTVYVYSKFSILRKCTEVYIKTYFHKQFTNITFKEISTDDNDSVEKEMQTKDVNSIIKNSLNKFQKIHNSLKLKEKHKVWIIYIDSFEFSNKNCSVTLLNTNVLNCKANFHIFKGKLDCINERTYDLEKSKLLNENLKRLFSKDSKLVKY